ncbi:MAG: glycosyltransferase [Acidimicrobiales bacterium]
MTVGSHDSERLSVREVEVPVRPLDRLEPIVGPDRFRTLRRAADRTRRRLGGRAIWNVNSAAAGGGVAEMLQVLVGYTLDAGIDVHWLVMGGDAEFFSITKRIHNRLHGVSGDADELGAVESAHYAAVTSANAHSMLGRIRPGDLVILHDPQTAGMAAALGAVGARVLWRCHVGREDDNRWTAEAWAFLRPHLAACTAYVFTLPSYVPPWMDRSRTWVIPPSIDPLSPKNQYLSAVDAARVLRSIGLMPPAGSGPPVAFTRHDGRPGRVEHEASILSDGPTPVAPGDPLVVQVSRWDRLKDMSGVMEGFASRVVGRTPAHLALVGPAVTGVADDPEGAEVYAECAARWRALPVGARRWISLVTLPMDDVDENAAMVNALQRHASVVVQKSLVEGFGLTVSEAMWKSTAVVASRVGGIAAQVAPGTGLLLDDPTDLDAFGDVLGTLLEHPADIARLGTRAHRHILDRFVTDQELLRFAELVEHLVP